VSLPPLPEIPENVPYILIGGGTASFAAYRAIRKGDPKAQVELTLYSEIRMYFSPYCLGKFRVTLVSQESEMRKIFLPLTEMKYINHY
jgi:hypothetical protein